MLTKTYHGYERIENRRNIEWPNIFFLRHIEIFHFIQKQRSTERSRVNGKNGDKIESQEEFIHSNCI